MKGILYDAAMALSEDEIRGHFPKGAVQTRNRFKPARTKAEATKTLAKMLADKRKRLHGKRLLGKTHGYTENPAHALQTRPDAGEAIDEASQFEQSIQAREDFEVSHEAVGRTDPKVYMARRIQNKKAA